MSTGNVNISVLFLLLQEKNEKNRHKGRCMSCSRKPLSASPMLSSLVTFLFSDKKVTEKLFFQNVKE